MVIVEVSLSPPSPDASAASLLNLAGPPLAGRFSFYRWNRPRMLPQYPAAG